METLKLQLYDTMATFAGVGCKSSIAEKNIISTIEKLSIIAYRFRQVEGMSFCKILSSYIAYNHQNMWEMHKTNTKNM